MPELGNTWWRLASAFTGGGSKIHGFTDPHAAEKTAKKIEAIIWSESQQASYKRIKQVFKPITYGGALQRLDIPETENGRVVQGTDGKPLKEVLLR